MAEGGGAGVGARSRPVAGLDLTPATAAALRLPVLIVQDVISVWSFRKPWDGWIIAWMLPGAALGILAGWFFAERVNAVLLLSAFGSTTVAFGLDLRRFVEGKRVSVRLDLSGRRSSKKKNN